MPLAQSYHQQSASQLSSYFLAQLPINTFDVTDHNISFFQILNLIICLTMVKNI